LEILKWVVYYLNSGSEMDLAVVCFALRDKGHAEGPHYYDQVTGDDSHVHVNK